MSDVALLSNYKTRNLGNLALTRSVQRLLARAYGPDHLLALHRLPHPIAEHAARRELDWWVASLQSQLGPLDTLPAPSSSDFGERTPGLAAVAKEQITTSAPRQLAVRAAHSGVGIRLRARLDRSTGQHHLGVLLAADDVVWNPGGEINTISTPTTRLVEVNAAIAQGRRVAMVNMSFEATPEARDFFRRRLPRFDYVIGRDETTVGALLDLGAPVDRTVLAPDAVFLVGSEFLPELPSPPPMPTRDVVGIVLHGLTPIDAEPWRLLVDEIRRQGSTIEIISSHKTIDGLVIEQLIDAVGGVGLTVLPEFTDIPRYLAHLAGLRAVVTARFHTAVMGLISGTTVVGVDTYGHKIAGGLTAAGFGDAVAAGRDWPEQAAATIAGGRRASASSLATTRARILAAWDDAFPLG